MDHPSYLSPREHLSYGLAAWKTFTRVGLLILFFVIGFLGPGWALNYTRGINNPNAQSMGPNSLSYAFSTYNNGGIQNRLLISIYEFFDIGVSFDIQRAIGDNKSKFNEPGVLGKIKFTNGSRKFPIFVSLGYDAFYTDPVAQKGQERPHNLEQIFLGPYLLVTKPIYLFQFEQFVNFGVRTPVQPDYRQENTAFFVGLDVPLGQYFILQTEIDRIYTQTTRWDEMLFNLGFRFQATKDLSISFVLMSGWDRMANRMLSLEYSDQF